MKKKTYTKVIQAITSTVHAYMRGKENAQITKSHQGIGINMCHKLLGHLDAKDVKFLT